MEFCGEVVPPAYPAPLARCRFCLQPSNEVRLARRDLADFYTTFWGCGLGQKFSQNEACGWVCAYCWTRASQCVKFVQCARAAENILSGGDANTDSQEFKCFHLSQIKLESTEYNFTPNTDNCKELQRSSFVPREDLIYCQGKCESISDSTLCNAERNLQTETQDEKQSVFIKIDAENTANENVKWEIESSDADSSVNLEQLKRAVRKGKLRKTMKEEIREKEMNKLKDLHVEPLTYSIADQLQEIRMKKMSENYLSKKFRCEQCGSSYNDEEAYEMHFTKCHHESAGELKCAVCGYRFPAAPALRAHRATHARRWRCLDCGRVLVKRGQCVTHHARCGAAPQTHACHLCGNSFPSEIRMKVHVRKSHTRRKEKAFSCDICGRSFIYKYQIRDHIRSHLNIKPFQCELCGKKFTNQSLYNSHQKAHGPPAAPEERYCVECDRHFTSPRLLESHLTSSLRHVTKESFRHACSECPERFKVASHLQLHVNTVHLDNRAHACQQCDKAYYTKAALKIHVRNKHTQRERRRDHVCPVCSKSFLASTTLKDHMVGVHSNERPYACDICGATFGFKAALYTHNKLKHKSDSGEPRRQRRRPR